MTTALDRAKEHALAGRFDLAEAALRHHAARRPDDAAAAYLMGYCLVRLGRMEPALPHLERAAAHTPPQRDALIEHACALFDLGRFEDGLARARRAAALFPDAAKAHAVLARMLLQGGLFVDAMESALRALHLAPHAAHVLSTFASCLAGLGRAEEAAAWFERAAAADPADPQLRANLCFALHAVASAEPAAIFESHREFGRLVSERAPAGRPLHPDTDPNRALRVGFMSPDLRDHPVARFLAPILAHLDRARFQPFAYSAAVRPDDTTAALSTRFAGWRDVATLGGDALADLIRRDRIDILIDLAGLTGGTRVPVMASRPAPVQMTYLGYPDTTGVPGVDYRLTDAVADPPGAEAFATETLLRLPGCLLCFEPPADAPPTLPRPEHAGLVFGSFNNPTKLSDATLALWRSVLDAVPGSRLVIKGKGLTEPRCRAAFERRLAQAGLTGDLAGVIDYAPTQTDHLAAYAGVDVALDTYPYAGTTTTCEALWMGVPVVTLAGRTHASRMSASILTAAGRPAWIAATPRDYAAIAARLAADRHALAETRASLREQTARSALCNAPRFVHRFEDALRDAWRAFAQAHPAARPAA